MCWSEIQAAQPAGWEFTSEKFRCDILIHGVMFDQFQSNTQPAMQRWSSTANMETTNQW